MSLRTTATSTFGVAAVVAASGVAASASASADVKWELPQTCTVSYSSSDGSAVPASQTFQAPVAAAYATHGSLMQGAKGSYVHVENSNVQITIPQAVYADMVKTGVTNNPSVSGAEYFTVGQRMTSVPFSISVPKSWNPDNGVWVASADGQATDIPAAASEAGTDGLVKVLHTGTAITWKNGPVTANLVCGKTGTGSVPTGPTTKPSEPTTKPSTPATTKPSNPGVPAQPSTPAQPATPGQGPKVQTDKVSEGSNAGTTAAFGGAAALALAGTAVAARRRKN